MRITIELNGKDYFCRYDTDTLLPENVKVIACFEASVETPRRGLVEVMNTNIINALYEKACEEIELC